MGWQDKLTEKERELLAQAEKPYGSVDERYLRDWLRDTLRTIARLRGLVEAIRGQAGGALEIAANDLEALDAGVEVTERGATAPWARARRAIDHIYAFTEETMEGIERGVAAMKAGRVRPWEDVERELALKEGENDD